MSGFFQGPHKKKELEELAKTIRSSRRRWVVQKSLCYSFTQSSSLQLSRLVLSLLGGMKFFRRPPLKLFGSSWLKASIIHASFGVCSGVSSKTCHRKSQT